MDRYLTSPLDPSSYDDFATPPDDTPVSDFLATPPLLPLDNAKYRNMSLFGGISASAYEGSPLSQLRSIPSEPPGSARSMSLDEWTPDSFDFYRDLRPPANQEIWANWKPMRDGQEVVKRPLVDRFGPSNVKRKKTLEN
jgi:hypothetical protein